MKKIGKILVGFLAVIGLISLVILILANILADRDGEAKHIVSPPSDKALFKIQVAKLQAAGGYAPDTAVIRMTSVRNETRAREIRDYFQLDTLYDTEASTWEKTLAVARFVATNIPHNNQKVQPEKRNAIYLWEYTKTVEPAFNCRLHSILLYELLQSINIEAKYITCMPMDPNDTDCHVVNHVWLPELGKWAMIDSDMGGNYATDATGTPLSLAEIRESYILGNPVFYHPAFVAEGNKKISHHHGYMAKNTYWFSCWETLHYDQEPEGDWNRGRYIHLVPCGFEPFLNGPDDCVTTDDTQFWAAPTQFRATPANSQ